jgi:hypothetical protein
MMRSGLLSSLTTSPFPDAYDQGPSAGLESSGWAGATGRDKHSDEHARRPADLA